MIKVAIVEDNDTLRKSLELLIGGSSGYEVIGTCPTADEALEKLPLWKPDVVLMDINLGIKSSVNGIECIKKLVQMKFEGQFMMCTVFENDDLIFDAIKAGATGYILKKSTPVEILDAISNLHNGGSPMSAEIARRVVKFLYQNDKKNENGHVNEEEIEKLTTREKDILKSLSEGLLYKEIAHLHTISMDTVRRHVHNIYSKLHVNNRTEALNRIYKIR